MWGLHDLCIGEINFGGHENERRGEGDQERGGDFQNQFGVG